jgi:hypothetical protein
MDIRRCVMDKIKQMDLFDNGISGLYEKSFFHFEKWIGSISERFF